MWIGTFCWVIWKAWRRRKEGKESSVGCHDHVSGAEARKKVVSARKEVRKHSWRRSLRADDDDDDDDGFNVLCLFSARVYHKAPLVSGVLAIHSD